MGNSLQDQLLKANLANRKQMSKAKKQKHKARKKDADKSVDAIQVQHQMDEKVARDRELNRQKQEEAKRKSVEAEIRQLIESNRVSRKGGETPYHFVEKTTVRKFYVTEQIHAQLVSGVLSVVKFGSQYEVVPRQVADKILLRDEQAVLQRTDSTVSTAEHEEYVEYVVPDDLMW